MLTRLQKPPKAIKSPSSSLETAIKETQVEAGQLANAQARLNLAQDPVLFAKQLEELDVRIEGIGYDNYKKMIENQDVAFMAELSKELKIIEVEQAGLRSDLVREQIVAARTKNGLVRWRKRRLSSKFRPLRTRTASLDLSKISSKQALQILRLVLSRQSRRQPRSVRTRPIRQLWLKLLRLLQSLKLTRTTCLLMSSTRR